MKILDEKGKLFGIINLIDLVVLLVILAVVGAAGYYYVGRKVVSNVPVEKQDVYVTVNCILVPEESALALVPEGDEQIHLVAKNAFQNAIIDTVSYRDSDYVGEDAQGKPVLGAHPLWKTVTVVIKDKASKADPIVKVGGQEARIGYKYTVKTQKVEIQGTVTQIEFK